MSDLHTPKIHQLPLDHFPAFTVIRKTDTLVAQQAGFGSEASLRQHFSRTLNISPARYRKEFRGF